MKKLLVNGLLVSILMFGSTLLQANEYAPADLEEQSEEGVPDTFQLRLGAYLLANQGTDLGFSQDGAGINLDLQDLFNMESSSQVVRIDGYYRFTPRHALEFSWYSIKNESETDNDVNFSWDGKDYNASGSLKTHFNTDIYKLNYLYSFYHSEKVELALSVGLHITAIDIGFSGTYQSDRVEENKKQSVNVTAPLPVAGIRLAYNFSPKWRLTYAADYFAIGFENFRGSLSDQMLTVDYRVTRHFGLGLGLNSTHLNLSAESDEGLKVAVRHDIGGGLLYGTLNF